jgi:hypothetical protein
MIQLLILIEFSSSFNTSMSLQVYRGVVIWVQVYRGVVIWVAIYMWGLNEPMISLEGFLGTSGSKMDFVFLLKILILIYKIINHILSLFNDKSNNDKIYNNF